MRHAGALLVAVFATLACENQVVSVDDFGDAAAAGGFVAREADEQALTRSCRPTETLKGIDVSYYQEQVDWRAARADDVAFAFIRVSDGVGFVDPRFDDNWAAARAAGVKRGAYQFFRSNKDPIAQADLLLQQMGPLEEGDLPPVIDVESTDGQSPATVAAKVARWVEHVQAALGVRPIIYTGPYFWRDNVGGQAFGDYPLWIAHYGTDCPLVPEPWTRFTFHQFTDSGRVAGVRGNVDTNVFAGTLDDLEALSFHAGAPGAPAAPALECAPIPAGGRVVDEDENCVTLGGPREYLRAIDGEGHAGGLVWTHTTSHALRTNYAEWTLRFDAPGAYTIAAWTDTSVASSRQARYRVEHDGVVDSVTIDQRTTNGFRTLGTFRIQGTTAKVSLNDNTGEAGSLDRVLVIDALQVTPAASAPAAPTCSRVRVVNAEQLNVRSSASTSRAAIGALNEGEVVDRLRSVDGQSIQGNRTWHEVRRGSLRGYVSAYYTSCAN